MGRIKNDLIERMEDVEHRADLLVWDKVAGHCRCAYSSTWCGYHRILSDPDGDHPADRWDAYYESYIHAAMHVEDPTDGTLLEWAYGGYADHYADGRSQS